MLPPKVDFGEITRDGERNRYFEEKWGPNMFDYFFYLRREGDLASVSWEEERRDPNFFWDLHSNVGIQCYPHGKHDALKRLYGSEYTDLIHRWYYENRVLAGRVLREHVGIRGEILRELRLARQALIPPGEFVLGCHMRGTDKSATIGGRKILPEEYFPWIDRFVEEKDARIFLATDDPHFVVLLKQRFGERVVCNRVQRDQRNAFLIDEGSPYAKGLEVLLDCFMLSKCDFLRKSSSAVSEFALFFNLDLHDRSFNLQYDCTRFLRDPSDNGRPPFPSLATARISA